MNEDLLHRLTASPDYDAAVLRIAEGDFGYEEREEPMLFVQLLLRDGTILSRDFPESLVDDLGLAEGDLCRLSDWKT